MNLNMFDRQALAGRLVLATAFTIFIFLGVAALFTAAHLSQIEHDFVKVAAMLIGGVTLLGSQVIASITKQSKSALTAEAYAAHSLAYTMVICLSCGLIFVLGTGTPNPAGAYGPTVLLAASIFLPAHLIILCQDEFRRQDLARAWDRDRHVLEEDRKLSRPQQYYRDRPVE